MARPRTVRTEGSQPDPVPGNNGEALARILTFFQAEHPDAWEELRLCPLQHGIQDMVERLK